MTEQETGKGSNECFQIINGKKTDRYFHWEEILDDRPELIKIIENAPKNEKAAKIREIIDSL